MNSATNVEPKNGVKYRGVVVPMVTPVTIAGDLDEPAVDRLVDFLLAAEVDGVFVLGTTGEGIGVPYAFRRRLVEHTVARIRHRAAVYAGIGGIRTGTATVGNDCFRAGADAVVACPPSSMPLGELLTWFRELLERLEGPLILYNMPSTTNVSIPLDVVGQLLGHPNLAGIKDSENDERRLIALLQRFGRQPGFSVFVGVGKLMARGLKLGAAGIVPSVGNLIPGVCRQLWTCAQCGEWEQAALHAERMNAVSALYQNGRTLGQSLAALKGALHCRGLCAPNVLPPLLPLSPPELETMRGQLSHLAV